MNPEPRRLGKYELQERLGQGGMAEVWKALDTQLQRHVAIKVLHPDLQADPDFVIRFRREAQVIASLRHPNIVQIHDFQVSRPAESGDPIAYMVMAYVEGQTLADYLANSSARGKIPSPAEIVQLFTSISLAVDYAHQKGMIHRDIKPANILLDKHNTARNPMGEPILTDFGLAKLLGVSAGTLTATQLGTPLYASPEQARGYPGNERSDLYSLGVILYEMVTGAPPFRGDTPTAVLSQHLTVAPTPPALLNPNIPPALTLVIMKALAKDPNARFSSAAAMTAAIAEALNVPVPEILGQPTYPADLQSMPTYLSSPPVGTGMTSSSSMPIFAMPSPSAEPSSSGGTPRIMDAARSSGTPVPANVTPQLVAPTPWQSHSVSTSGATGTPSQGSSSLPAGAIQGPPTPSRPVTPTPPIPPVPPSSQSGRRWKPLYTALAVLLILVLLGSGLGAYFLFFNKNNNLPATVPGGQAFFLSSGQLNPASAQGIADQMQIQLQNIPDPQPGKSYYAWLLADRQPKAEKDPLQPPPQFTLPLLLGRLSVSQGRISFFYKGTPQHDNLFSLSSRLLITEEDTNGTPRGPAAERSAWRYYAEIPQTPYGDLHLSALDHIRHLFYKETKVAVLGLPGGLDIWLFRNTEKLMEWSISARDDYSPHASDISVIHNLFVDILDYLDGSANVYLDVPAGTPIAADQVVSRVALLSIDTVQQKGEDLSNNPPGYLDHVPLHLNGVVQAPDATPQLRALASEIIHALNNVAIRLQQVRAYAQQLVKMDANQLSQPSTLTMLDNMLANTTYAYIGQLDPKTNQVVPGVLQVHYDIQRLATLNVTPNLPKSI